MNRILRMLVCVSPLTIGANASVIAADQPIDGKNANQETASSRRVAVVDRSTLTGKVMCGYQGWFNCEGDGAGLGWTHWAKKGRQSFAPGNVTVDLWPDISELDPDEVYETGFRHADGTIAKVFSSANRKTVLRHFQWMQDYGIDGVFLQRFASELNFEPKLRHRNAVLGHVRQGAQQAGRSYALMYDLTGLSGGGVKIVRDDWQNLRTELQLTEDETYQQHNGKPVVAIWGVGFGSKNRPRKYSLAECRELIEFLKADGCAVMLGVPTGWRLQERDSITDPELHEVLKLADVISPWTVGRYRTEADVEHHVRKYWRIDKRWCDNHGMEYMPVVFPGFSWYNMEGEKFNFIPRKKGEFLWSQIVGAKQARCQMLYVAMFDEVDEGTAIFKCTNDPPTGNGAKFIDYEGLPSDAYLRLVGKAGALMRGEAPLTKNIPQALFD